MKKYLTLTLALISAIIVTLITNKVSIPKTTQVDASQNITIGALNQHIIGHVSTPKETTCLYYQDHLLGTITDSSMIQQFLKDLYKKDYQQTFENSELSLASDMYTTTIQDYNLYENIDQQLIDYIKANDLVAIKATAVELSDDKGNVYAKFYVKNEELYTKALQTYLSYYIDTQDFNLLNNGHETPPLKTYGSRPIGVSIAQNITLEETFVSKEDVKMSEEEILEYIKYGDNKDRTYYTVVQNDTVAGVGMKNFGLTATQVMNINRDKIQSVDQVLEEGMELCTTYFTPIMDVIITKEHMKKEPIYFEAIYQQDDTLRAGVTEIIQQGIDGSKNSLYEEKWINGILVSGKLMSSIDTMQPTTEIMKVGTIEIPGFGTGTYRWPTDNPNIINGWLGYPGHLAIDVQDSYNHYGPVYASDRGVIEENSYHPISGNYVFINHNNGYRTYYGHMSVPSPLPVGTIVDKGDIIGTLGMTGLASTPHTHFYIEGENGIHINPCDGYIKCFGDK